MNSLRSYFEITRRFGLKPHHEVTLLGLLLSATVFESIGIAMLLPIVEFIQADNDLAALQKSSPLWESLVKAYDFFALQVNLATLIVTSFLCIVVRQVFSYYRQVYFQKLMHGLIRDMRNTLFEAYLEADASYHDREKTGGVVNSMTTELILAVQTVLAPVQMATYGLMIVAYTVLLLIVTGPVTVGAAVVLCISGFLLKRFIDKTAYVGGGLAEANEKMSTFLVQRLGSIRLIRLSGAESAEREEMSTLTGVQRQRYVDINVFLARVNVLMEPIALAIGFIVLYLGISFLDLKLEEIAVFAILAIMRLLPTVKELLATGQSALGSRGSLLKLNDRYSEMLAARESRGGNRRFEPLTQGIEFRNASFNYPMAPDIPALNDISFTIPAGKMTAIVGRSGAGKSTLIDLLPRLREPTSGEILFDGRAASEFDTASIRRGMAYVSQNAIVFNVTAAEQIAYGLDGVKQSDIENAARMAGAHDFIERLPEGYETLVGERGIRLSGGQLQRLDLARALIRKAPVLILDEPTSNLDAESEARFRETLENIRNKSNATIIVVAHRLSTIKNADQIVVLNDGKVDAVGHHDEVIAISSWYRDAYEKQSVGIFSDPEPARSTTV